MKTILCLALCLILIVPGSLASSTGDGYVDEIIIGIPITTHEFLARYLILADKYGESISGAADVVFDTGSLISLKYVTMYTDKDNALKVAYFRLPDIEGGSADYLNWLFAYIEAFRYNPIAEAMSSYIKPPTAEERTQEVLSIIEASEKNKYIVDKYGLYYDTLDGGSDVIVATFVGR